MSWTIGFILQPDNVWMLVAIVAAWLVVACLKAIASEVDNVRRRNKLEQHVRVLRDLQLAQRQQASGSM